MTPAVIRMKDAPTYVGMSEAHFNTQVRPNVREVVIGIQGVAFLRNDLDEWATDYFNQNAVAKPDTRHNNGSRIWLRHEKGNASWRGKVSLVSTNETESGTSTKSSKDSAFKKALDQARGKKQKTI